MTELEDFIPVYNFEGIDGTINPQIQNIITLKKEFAELEAQLKEPVPKRGTYYLHQKFFARLSRAVDRIFNIQKTGTGKSCAFIGAAEMLMLKGGYKRTYLMEKGDATIHEMKQQIICKCTNVYETETIKQSTSSRSQKSNITREIKNNYELTTYYSFAKKVQNMTERQLIEEFSGCIFILDEAHNIIGAAGEDISEKKRNIEIYNSILRAFQTVERCKIFVVTATPMINDVSEIAPMMNLLLPKNRQLPTNWDYRYVTLSQMEPYFRGMVTFVESLETGAIPKYIGIKPNYIHKIEYPTEGWLGSPIINGQKQIIPPVIVKDINSQIVLSPISMGDIQSYVYDRLINKPKTSTFNLDERQASCFVFPDGSFGGSLIKKTKAKKDETDETDEDDITEEMLPNQTNTPYGASKYIKILDVDKYELITPPDFYGWSENPNKLTFNLWINNDNNLSNLMRLSGKYAYVIYNETQLPGNSFMYMEFLNGSGAIIFSLCLECFGFEKFDESSSVFVPTGKSNDNSICSSESKKLKEGFTKKRRYAMLNSKVSPAKQAALLELFNSPENIDGEYIKMIIGTRVARDGINLSHCLRVYMGMAGWHPSGMLQAINRVIRATSHDLIIQRIIANYMKEGKTLEEAISISKISIDIYNLTSISLNPQSESIDKKIYIAAEDKDIYIRRIMRMAKQCAVDCRINYKRNIKVGNIDGSPECDYDICQYQCSTANNPFDANSPDLDFTTYDILYSDEAIESCIIEIIKIIQNDGSVTFKDLLKIFVETKIYRTTFIYQAVDRIVERKIKIRNRFGYDCYIVTDGFTIFTQRDYTLNNVDKNIIYRDISIYNKELVGVKVDTFENISYKISLPSNKIYINNINNIKNINSDKGMAELDVILKEMTFDWKMHLLESAILQIVESPQGQVSDIANAIKNKFINFIYRTYEDEEKNIEIARNLNSKAKKLATPLKNLNVDKTEVYLHIYKILDTGNSKYNRLNNYFNPYNIRILDTKDKLGWRDVLPYEEPNYKNTIIETQKKILSRYSSFNSYGIILDDIFYIVNNTNKDIKDINVDMRSVNKGKICESYSIGELIKILLADKIIPPEIIKPVTLNRPQVIQFIYDNKYMTNIDDINKFTDYDLSFIYLWYQVTNAKNFICSLLREFYINNKRMYII